MRLVAEEMVAGRLTVDEAAAELDRRADAILEKRRWLLDRGVEGGKRGQNTFSDSGHRQVDRYRVGEGVLTLFFAEAP
jgi:hypothetical protein